MILKNYINTFNYIIPLFTNMEKSIDTENFWMGEYGVRVSNDFNHIYAKDGGNLIHKPTKIVDNDGNMLHISGGQTEMGIVKVDYLRLYNGELDAIKTVPILTEKEYKTKYCFQGHDGYYYYRGGNEFHKNYKSHNDDECKCLIF